MTTTRRLEHLAKRIYRDATPQVLGQRYAWVFGFTEKGKKVIDGPFAVPIGMDVSEEAERVLEEFPSGEVFILKTRNMTRAKSEIKAILLQRGENPDEALKRVMKKK